MCIGLDQDYYGYDDENSYCNSDDNIDINDSDKNRLMILTIVTYFLNRSTSVVIWIVGVLIVCEMFSTFFRVPLSSTLAFGGVGGLAIGLSARDIAANFLGGMLLLFNEPFTPGDMVTFRTGTVRQLSY